MKNPTFTFLEQIKDNLEYVDYKMIYQSIADLKDKFVLGLLTKKCKLFLGRDITYNKK